MDVYIDDEMSAGWEGNWSCWTMEDTSMCWTLVQRDPRGRTVARTWAISRVRSRVAVICAETGFSTWMNLTGVCMARATSFSIAEINRLSGLEDTYNLYTNWRDESVSWLSIFDRDLTIADQQTRRLFDHSWADCWNDWEGSRERTEYWCRQ